MVKTWHSAPRGWCAASRTMNPRSPVDGDHLASSGPGDGDHGDDHAGPPTTCKPLTCNDDPPSSRDALTGILEPVEDRSARAANAAADRRYEFERSQREAEERNRFRRAGEGAARRSAPCAWAGAAGVAPVRWAGR